LYAAHFRPLLKRAARYAGVGTFVLTPISFGIYMALIHVAHLGVLQAGVARACCMLPLTFLAGRYFTWRSRRKEMGELLQFSLHFVGWLVASVVHQAILAVSLQVGVHYVAAYWIAVTMTGVFKFFWGDKVSFAYRLRRQRTVVITPSEPAVLRAPGA
jgi:putative flippase GtrA